MSGKTATQIDPQQGIHIEMIEMQVDVRGPVAADMNRAINYQVGFFELRASGNLHVRAASDQVKVEVPGAFTVEGEIAEVQLSVDDGSCERAGALGDKVHPSVNGYSGCVQLRDVLQVEVCSRQIETKFTGGQVKRATSGYTGSILR